MTEEDNEQAEEYGILDKLVLSGLAAMVWCVSAMIATLLYMLWTGQMQP